MTTIYGRGDPRVHPMSNEIIGYEGLEYRDNNTGTTYYFYDGRWVKFTNPPGQVTELPKTEKRPAWRKGNRLGAFPPSIGRFRFGGYYSKYEHHRPKLRLGGNLRRIA